VFFDRGLLDAAAALRHAGGDVAPSLLSAPLYNRQVFMTPPWPEIYTTDTQRRHELLDAVAEYVRLCAFYPRHGYTLRVLPKLPVTQRADWCWRHWGLATGLGGPAPFHT
jgi:predicted ATPase